MFGRIPIDHSVNEIDRIAAGAPAYAWAGLVVLGDGDLVPLPGGRRWFDFPVWAASLAGFFLLGFLLITWRRRLRG